MNKLGKRIFAMIVASFFPSDQYCNRYDDGHPNHHRHHNGRYDTWLQAVI